MVNIISTNKGISDLLQAAKVTHVEIRGLCCHGSVCYMAKNDRISCQDTQDTNSTLKMAESEVQIGCMASFLLKWASNPARNSPVLCMSLL